MVRRTHDEAKVAHPTKPLYIVPSEDGTSEEYFFSDQELDAAIPPEAIARALALAGAWSDLDGEEMLAALDRIRHERMPTPPIDDRH